MKAAVTPARRRYVVALAALFGLEWAVLAVSPRYRQDWILENVRR